MLSANRCTAGPCGRLTKAICENVVEALGISADDVFIALIPVPKENFSFGKGELQLAPVS